MKRTNPVAIFIVFLIIFGMMIVAAADDVKGRSTGWGWCAKCGADRKLSSHDFTHGEGSRGGNSGYSSDQMAADVIATGANAFMKGFNREIQRQQMERQRLAEEAYQSNLAGNEYFERYDYDNAIMSYEQALRFAPHDNVIRNNLNNARAMKVSVIGDEYYDNGDMETAVRYYEDALSIAPGDEWIRRRLNNARRDIAIKDYESQLPASRAKLSKELGDLAEELGTSTAPAGGAFGFMESDELAVDTSDLRNASNEMTKEQAIKEYSETRDHSYKTLTIKDVPPPVLEQQISTETVKGEGDDPELWKNMKEGSNNYRKEASEWIDKKKEEFKVWTYGETYDRTVGRAFRGAKKIKEFKDDVEEGIKDMKEIVDEPYSHAQKGMQQGPAYLADPDDGGKFEENYNEGIQGAGDRAIDKTNKMRNKNIKKHLN